ncbi:oligosaccharide flippase family protein [Deinococcus antarcticus]|uniref:Oligosaccharide flippase family protein n=1 Tax=Deinococcus antarcticus TaxID=1298767 RepID=A0ABV8A273_9DEIO
MLLGQLKPMLGVNRLPLQAKLIAGNLFNNLVSLVIVFFAAKLMTHAEYFKVGIITTIVATYSIILDFGFNTSLVKFSIEDKDFRYKAFSSVLIIKLLLTLIISLAVVTLNTKSLFPGISVSELVWSIWFGWALSVWTSLRAFNQADGSLEKSVRRIYFYAVSRVTLAILFLYLQQINALSLNLTLYFIPLFLAGIFDAIFIVKSSNLKLFTDLDRERLVRAFKYGLPVWLSAILYIILTRILVIYEANIGDKMTSSSFNLALSYVAFVSLLNDSFRYILLPKAVSSKNKNSILDNWHSINQKVPLLFALLILSLIIFAIFNYIIFERKYPHSTIFLIVIYLSYSINSIIGIYNIFAHSISNPKIDFISNIIRTVLLFIILIFIKPNALISVILFGIILVTTEILGHVFLRRNILRIQ